VVKQSQPYRDMGMPGRETSGHRPGEEYACCVEASVVGK
jgi:hypothetical protein